MTRSIMMAIAVAALGAGSADATITNYYVSGILDGGTTFSGSFGSDDSLDEFLQFTNIDITVGGSTLNHYFSMFFLGSSAGTTPFGIRFDSTSSPATNYLQLTFIATHDGFIVHSIADQSFRSDSGLVLGTGNTVNVASGTISSTMTTSVPEPATWAMFVCGFGLIGAALRSRKVRISFA
jgi:hypothetical protein